MLKNVWKCHWEPKLHIAGLLLTLVRVDSTGQQSTCCSKDVAVRCRNTQVSKSPPSAGDSDKPLKSVKELVNADQTMGTGSPILLFKSLSDSFDLSQASVSPMEPPSNCRLLELLCPKSLPDL